jgi:hypothetical protein
MVNDKIKMKDLNYVRMAETNEGIIFISVDENGRSLECQRH